MVKSRVFYSVDVYAPGARSLAADESPSPRLPRADVRPDPLRIRPEPLKVPEELRRRVAGSGNLRRHQNAGLSKT